MWVFLLAMVVSLYSEYAGYIWRHTSLINRTSLLNSSSSFMNSTPISTDEIPWSEVGAKAVVVEKRLHL